MNHRGIVIVAPLALWVLALLAEPGRAFAQAPPAPSAEAVTTSAEAATTPAEAAPSAQATTTAAAPPAVPAVGTPGPVHLDQSEPPPGKIDWVQLNNGEWMNGEFLWVRDGGLEFDSDEFGVHAMDLADIARIFLRTRVEVGLTGLETLSGTAVLDKQRIVVQTAEGEREAPRSAVMSIVPTAEWELGYWSLDAAVGLNLARGNSDQGTLSVSNLIKREDSFTRLKLDYQGNYGESKGDKNTHNHRGLVNFDLFVSDKFFVTPAMLTLEYDEFKNLKMRATPGAGAGIHIVRSAVLEWDVKAAGAYQYIKFLSVQPGEEETASNAAVVMGTTLDYDPTADLEFYFEYTNTLVVTDIGLTSHHFVGQMEVDLTKMFELDLKVIVDRTEEPVTDSDGTTPKKNDVQLVASLGIEFG